ncbi:MAG: transporter substrate-binding domain-containing protein [Eubacteriales bacterium]|nr:transporter substrate-binding domain-containing protein [Eubacteriales bacterium]
MKRITALLLALLLIFSFAACGQKKEEEKPAADSLVETIKARGKLIVGTEAQYAPYEYKNADAEFAGCDIWLAQQIADALGVELEIVDMAFDGIIPAVQAGQVDLGIAAFTRTDERAEVIDFSDLYEESRQLLVVAAGNADVYATKESLAGLQVGAQKGTVQSELIQKALPDSILFELEKYPALALEVQNGNIAGLVVDEAVGNALIANSNGALEASNFEFTQEEANFGKAVVCAKGNEDLLAIVNEVVNRVKADGSYQKAYDDAVEESKQLGL